MDENNNEEVSPPVGRLYQRGVREIEGLPLIGKIVLGFVVVLIICKMTPIVDLLYLLVQLVIIPALFLVALGVVSGSSYRLVIGWLDDTLVWAKQQARPLSSDSERPEPEGQT